MKFFLLLVLSLFIIPIDSIGQKIDTTLIPEAEIFYHPGSGGLIQKIPLDSQRLVSHTIGELFEKNSSVFINSNGVSGLQSISIRGTGSTHTAVFWNGLSIQSPTLGLVDLSTLSTSTIDQVEVHYGASALVDGSGGLGGSIQFSDQMHYDTLLHTSLQTGFGSFGKSYRKLKLNWATNKWSLLFGLGDVDAPNVFAFVNPATSNLRIDTLKNAGLKTFSTKLGIGYQWNENLKLEALVLYNSSNRELPKSITSNDFGDAFQTDKSWRGVMNLIWNKNRMIHQFTIGAIQDSLHFYSDFESKIKTSSYQGNYKLTYYLKNNLKIKSALEFNQQTANSDGFKNDVVSNKTALMVNPQWKWKNKLTADFILRVETIDEKIVPIMPSVLLHYQLNKRINFRATAARIYRNPTFNDLFWFPGGNPDLLPENGSSFELGVDFLTSNKNLSINITGYKSKIENWIIWLPVGSYSAPENLFLVKSKGLDFGMNYKKKWNKKLVLNANVNYSYVVSKNFKSSVDEDPSIGKQLIYVPMNRLNAGVDLTINNRWGIGYQYRFTDKRFITRDHSSWMPYFMLSDISAQYNFINMLWVDYISLNINNLLNKNYEVTPYQPMMQRNVMLNLKFKFEKQFQ